MEKEIRKYLLLIFLMGVVLQGWSQGKVIIQSDATGSGSLILGPQSSVVSVEVSAFIPSANWHIISPSVSGQQLGTFVTINGIVNNSTFGDYDLSPLDETTNKWQPFTQSSNTNPMEVGKGYTIRKTAAGNVSFSGAINAGTILVPISKNNLAWNAVGNPYTSGIKIKGADGFLTKNQSSMDPSFSGVYIWDHTQGHYVVITQAGYAFPAPGGETELDQDNIAVGQGFVVKALANGTVIFDSLMQEHASVSGGIASPTFNSWPAIRITVTDDKNKSSTVVTFNNEMKKDLDPAFDAGMFKMNEGIDLYTHLLDDNGVDFAVQCLPLDDYQTFRIPLGLDYPAGGLVQFTAETVDLPEGMEFYIEDKTTGVLSRIDSNKTGYSVTLPSQFKGTGRFYLLARQKGFR
ncbi:hypothetical protein [Flavobacterium granuli]|uniref:IgGFc-binding protein N-terminal domain-containing protein n=1 Tax=Flavobacterium granuli TaxID=280093 RepID=A0ABU1S4G6_9FLAO|nr:hypothetical protein [Flavobacterium granuli]MDR6845931.1 hypothetical protein [Flavobacterium granuli]